MSRRSIIYLSLRLRQTIDLLAADKSRSFAQPRPIIVLNYFVNWRRLLSGMTVCTSLRPSENRAAAMEQTSEVSEQLTQT